MCSDLFDRSLQLPDVAVQAFRQKLQNRHGNMDSDHFRLVFQNGEPQFIIRQLNIHDQSPLKATAQPVLQGFHFLRRSVGGQNDLLVIFIQSVEGMEEFLLCGLLAGNELNIINQQYICFPVFVAEGQGVLIGDAADQLVCEIVALDIHNVFLGKIGFHAVDDGIQKVGLSQTAVAVNKQRVEGGRGILGNGRAGRIGQFVGRTYNEVVKGVFIIGKNGRRIV